MTLRRMICALLMSAALTILPSPAKAAKRNSKTQTSLADYLARLPQLQTTEAGLTPGSLWIPGTGLTTMNADYKAHRVGDVVTVTIAQQTVAQAKGTVNTSRSFSASSGIDALAGKINTSGIQQLFSPHSDSKLTGSGQTASSSMLQTQISGIVVAMLPGDAMVVQAEREVLVNNERETVVLRGVARPGDVTAGNVVASSSLANLEIEVKGKGVISDATRPPNWIVRMLLKLVGF